MREKKPPRVSKKPLPRRDRPELKPGSLKIIIILSAVLIILLAGIIALTVYAFGRGGWIFVRGESPYTEEEIINATGVSRTELFFTDAEKAEASILASKPYIREVKLSRLFCFAVIGVKADKPAYFIINDGDCFILSEQLRVIDCMSSVAEAKETGAVMLELPDLAVLRVGYPVEYGAEDKNTYVADMLKLIKSKEYASAVTAIGLAGRYDDVYITFYGKCRIELGSINDFEEKMRIAETLLEDNRNSIYSCAIINVSVPSRPTFRPVDSLD